MPVKLIRKILASLMILVLFMTTSATSAILAEDEEVTHVVYFDSDGGSQVDDQIIIHSEKALRPQDPTKQNYTFDNWYLDETEYDFDNPVENDITLLAKWIENDIQAGNQQKTDVQNELYLQDNILNNSLTESITDNNIYVSSSGDDINGDGTQNNPYASISKACNVSSHDSVIVLLSDISIDRLSGIWHNITIKSKDNEGPYKIIRAEGFASSSDRLRTQYNPAMFEVHSDNGPVVFTLSNIILDDNHLSQGSLFRDQSSGNNINIVQDAIIAVYEDPAKTNSATLILDENTTLQNYGGMSAVSINGPTSKLIMKSGSLITNNGVISNGYGAIVNGNGTIEMHNNATIDSATGTLAPAILSNNGINMLDGIISNCTGKNGADYAILNLRGGDTTISENAKIHGNSTKNGTIYAFLNAVVHIKGEIFNNRIIDKGNQSIASAIYASDNGGYNTKVYIEDGANIHDNKGGDTIVSFGPYNFEIPNPFSTAVLANNVSSIIMNGGTITNNQTYHGVMIRKNGYFEMNGGQITNNDTGVIIFNYNNEVKTARAVLNKGTIKDNSTDLSLYDSNVGYHAGSYYYISENMMPEDLKLYFSNGSKRITPIDTNLYLGNNTPNAVTALKNIDEISSGTLIANWYCDSDTDIFKMKIENLIKRNDDVYLCLLPLNEDKTAKTDSYKIYACNKDNSGTRMTVNIDTKGNGNEYGYAFGLFTQKIDRQYTLHYETFQGTEIKDKTQISFNDDKLSPEIIPEKYGSRFVGWYMDKDFIREYSDTNTYADIVENEVTCMEATLYAKYEDIIHSIRFNLNGGTYNGSSDDIIMECKLGTTIKTLSVPEKDGFIFLYWKGSQYGPNQDYLVTEDHEFTAQWQKIEEKIKRFSIPITGIDCKDNKYIFY